METLCKHDDISYNKKFPMENIIKLTLFKEKEHSEY